MKKFIYLLLFLVIGVTNAQRTGSTMLLVSQQQFANESVESYTVANVVSLNDEADSLTGISKIGTGTLSKVTGGAHDGSYYTKLTGGDGRIQITWSGLTSGNPFNFSFWYKVVGSFANVNLWTNVQEIGGGVADPQIGGAAYNLSATSWTFVSFPLETTSTSGIMRFYIGDNELHIDGVSIIELFLWWIILIRIKKNQKYKIAA